jgi:hypothetical protein
MAMTDVALVTLAIGQRYLDHWRTFHEIAWREYAQRHSFDLIVIIEPLDRSPRAVARSPSWQKCLALSQEFASRYRQVVLLDCDIAINPAAPSVVEKVPVERVGGVLSGGHIHDDLKIVLLERLAAVTGWPQPDPARDGLAQWQKLQRDAYPEYGFPQSFNALVQGGVLVASPRHHRAMFEAVYAVDADSRCYEQVPMSYALLASGLLQPIDSRFNSVFYETMLVYYPYLLNLTGPSFDAAARAAVEAQYASNYFLHFAYDMNLARYLPLSR